MRTNLCARFDDDSSQRDNIRINVTVRWNKVLKKNSYIRYVLNKPRPGFSGRPARTFP